MQRRSGLYNRMEDFGFLFEKFFFFCILTAVGSIDLDVLLYVLKYGINFRNGMRMTRLNGKLLCIRAYNLIIMHHIIFNEKIYSGSYLR